MQQGRTQRMTDATRRAGLGKVIYSVDDKTDEPAQCEERAVQAEVREADEESFPATILRDSPAELPDPGAERTSGL